MQDSSWQRVFFGTCFGPIGGDEPEVGPGVAGRLREFQRERAGRLGRSMLGGERELVVMFPQAEKRIEPCIEVRRAAQAVSGATRGRGVLAKMMDQSDRDAGFSLQRPEVSEECGDLTGYIFVDGMDSHQRIEYEQHRVMDEDRGLEPVLVLDAIQAERLRCDNPDIETREVELADPNE